MLVLLWNRCHNVMGSETAGAVLSSTRWQSGFLRSVVASCLGLSAAIAVRASGGRLFTAACVGVLCALPSVISYCFKLTGKVARCLSAISLYIAAFLVFKSNCKPVEVAVFTALLLFALLDLLVCHFGSENDLVFDVHGGRKGVAKVTDMMSLILILVFSVLVAMRSTTFSNSVLVRSIIDSFVWCKNSYKDMKDMALV